MEKFSQVYIIKKHHHSTIDTIHCPVILLQIAAIMPVTSFVNSLTEIEYCMQRFHNIKRDIHVVYNSPVQNGQD